MSAETKTEQAYRQLEEMIVFEELPPGSLVSEATLMAKTGFGRTPVREAVQRLARHRMVAVHPNKGILVPETSVESQLKLLELRRPLETLAVTLACQRATPAQRDAMSAMIELLRKGGFSLREYADTVKGTHGLIVASAHNEYLSDAMAPLQGLSRRFWYSHVREPDRQIAAGSARHVAILAAILDRDESRAAAASQALNDYLVEFTYAVLGAAMPAVTSA